MFTKTDTMVSPIKKSTLIALAAFLLIFVAGCKKTLPENGKAELLTTGSWRMTAYTFYSIANTVDIYATYAQCEKDNIFHFNTDGTLDIEEGASKCDSTDPQAYSVNWRFLDNRQSRIVIDGTEFIATITDNEFELSTPYNDPYEDHAVMTYTR